MPPVVRLSRSTRSLAPGRRYAEPEMRTTVAIAARSPAPSFANRSRIAAVSCQCFTRHLGGTIFSCAAGASSSAAGAGHARIDPGFQRFHEFLVRERWNRAARARRPGPEDEWIHLHVLDDGLP